MGKIVNRINGNTVAGNTITNGMKCRAINRDTTRTYTQKQK